jgi:vancomycin resistance protein YoaR
MTTAEELLPPIDAEELLPPPIDAEVTPRPRLWPRFVGAFVVGLAVSLALAGAALAAWDAGYEGRILPGVRVGAVDLSGLDRDQASAALAAAYGDLGEGRLVLRTAVGDASISYGAFSRRPDGEAMVDAAMRAGREGTPIERAATEVRIAVGGLVLQPRVALDEDALASSIAAVLAPLDRAAVDATIAIGPVGYEISVARPGVAFDLAVVSAAALTAVGEADAPQETAVDASVIALPATIGDAAVMTALARLDQMVGDVVVTNGKTSWTIPAATVRASMRLTPTADGAVDTALDPASIRTALAQAEKDLRRDPVDAIFLTGRNGVVVGTTASRDGTRLDTAATSAAVAAAVTGRARGVPAASVPAVVTTISPKLTTAQAQQVAPLMVRLSSWQTYFPISERNYWGANIWQPARFIDGTVLYPGQTFEWWRAVGPVTPARGFGAGGFIAGDHTEPTGALGGGMCSSSTTLFNAALRAGLQMGARSNHKYYINRYPLGLDATVSMSHGRVQQTVTFTNDMKHPIVIRAYRIRSGGKGWVRYEIWGIPDGRQVSLSKPSVSNVRKATTRIFYTTTLRKGVRKQTEYPANGMDVSVTRVVRDSGGRIIHRETYRTHYQLWIGVIQVGV